MSTRTPRWRDADLRRKLVDLGIRVTEQRLLLLQALSSVRAPISHPELTERMSGSSLDRATIYRNLLALTDAGLLVRTQLGDNVWRYEMPRTQASQHHEHPHFVCTDCGQVACLPENAVQLRNARMRARVVEVQLRGRCLACDR
ncbi:MAG TPA: Fur family transcriptional regulator [Polyangiaceae bacterium]